MLRDTTRSSAPKVVAGATEARVGSSGLYMVLK